MEKLKSGTLSKIKQKLIMNTALSIQLVNKTKANIEYEIEEIPDGVRPKLVIKLRHIKKRLKRK